MNTLPTAREAARLVKTGEWGQAKKELEKITENILEAIDQGRRSISLHGQFHPNTIKLLKKKGYACDTWWSDETADGGMFVNW